MNEIDVKKQLLKSKAIAKLSRYESGNIYYTVQLDEGVWQFPISTIEENDGVMELSHDLDMTPFYSEMRGSELNRWIAKAIKSEEFIKIS